MFILLLVVLPLVILASLVFAVRRKWITLRIAICGAAGVLATFFNVWEHVGLMAVNIACGDSFGGCKPDPAWDDRAAILALPMSLIPKEYIAHGLLSALFNAVLWGCIVFFILRALIPRQMGLRKDNKTL